ncbi:MAG: thiamine pyrophosphate-binding protein [Alphaproteobacteria bacterium]|nr:thiamine pyrophosphate-binding protein [Alphaproteobacteria bacterium]
MTETLRGADIVAQSLERAGVTTIFTLSGNHIMSLFDAAIGTRLELIHVRQEAAAVHMADAWGRLTGTPGVAMVTGGPGQANAVPALFTALSQDSPLVLLAGSHATWEEGRGGFQEIDQAALAAPVSKASWTATSAASLGMDVARAFRIAVSGRPGPVHLSLPSDLLDAMVPLDAIVWPKPEDFAAVPTPMPVPAATAALALIAAAARPLLIAGPQLATRPGRALLARIEAALNLPTCIMESPRASNDATWGALGDVIKRADLVVLLGKKLDFTLKFGAPPTFDAASQVLMIEPDAETLARGARELGPRLALGLLADSNAAGEALLAGAGSEIGHPTWLATARTLLHARPAPWTDLASKTPGRLHAIEVARGIKPFVDADPDTILICDGGEYAQWAQSLLRCERRLVNGVAGAIGVSLPFAAAARKVEPRAPVIAVLGDGTFGFHMAEFETAVRCDLPFVAVVGTDARWNAEHNIQVRDYGLQRAYGCELNDTRYDLVVTALGGHGELVERAEDLGPAIARAIASGKPACVNVMIESHAAPTVRARDLA